MNMTKKIVYDQKHHTDKVNHWNMTENVRQQLTITGEYDRIQNNNSFLLFRSYSPVQVGHFNEFVE